MNESSCFLFSKILIINLIIIDKSINKNINKKQNKNKEYDIILNVKENEVIF